MLHMLLLFLIFPGPPSPSFPSQFSSNTLVDKINSLCPSVSKLKTIERCIKCLVEDPMIMIVHLLVSFF